MATTPSWTPKKRTRSPPRVEQGEGFAVFVAEEGCDPDDGAGVGAGGVGDELSEVAVVGGGELVFHDEDAVVGEVAADDVEGEGSDGVFGGGEFEVDAQRVGEDVGVVE
jgi:hypothetical protein